MFGREIEVKRSVVKGVIICASCLGARCAIKKCAILKLVKNAGEARSY